jgi:DNA-binding NarL/FixJ family response regulator
VHAIGRRPSRVHDLADAVTTGGVTPSEVLVVGSVRVLTVDDHATFRQAATALIAATDGFVAVGEAPTGQEGVIAAERLAPDLVLLDVGLPDIDGYEAARRIAAVRPDAMIVLVSAGVEALGGDPAARCGASAFVPKESLRPTLLRELWTRHRGAAALADETADAAAHSPAIDTAATRAARTAPHP